MSLIDDYQHRAHSDGFRLEKCEIDLNDSGKVNRLLKKTQKATRPEEGRFASNYEIQNIIKYIESSKSFMPPDNNDSQHLAIAKAKTSVSFHSLLSGVWAHVLFLKSERIPTGHRWVVYGYGRGRFSSHFLNLSKEVVDGIFLGVTIRTIVSQDQLFELAQ